MYFFADARYLYARDTLAKVSHTCKTNYKCIGAYRPRVLPRETQKYAISEASLYRQSIVLTM